MHLKWLVPAAIAASGMVFVSSSPKTYAMSSQAVDYVAFQPGWDTPPAEYHDVKRQGFHDGIEAARRDFDHHRSPDVNRHEDFRHPHVDPSLREDYREGYRRGYEVGMHHLMGEGPH